MSSEENGSLARRSDAECRSCCRLCLAQGGGHGLALPFQGVHFQTPVSTVLERFVTGTGKGLVIRALEEGIQDIH